MTTEDSAASASGNGSGVECSTFGRQLESKEHERTPREVLYKEYKTKIYVTLVNMVSPRFVLGAQVNFANKYEVISAIITSEGYLAEERCPRDARKRSDDLKGMKVRGDSLE